MPVTQNVYSVPNNFDLQYNQGQKKIRADLVDQNFDDAAEVITQLLGDAANSVHKTGNETIAGNKTFTGTVEIASLGAQLKRLILQSVFPVGTIYTTTNSTNPATLFGFGTWQQIKGRMLLGASNNHAVNSTGGEETHRLTWNEMPSHAHTRGTMEIWGTFSCEAKLVGGFTQAPSPTGSFGYFDNGGIHMGGTGAAPGSETIDFYASRTWSGETSYAGSNVAHNNMPPYYAAFIWRRTA